MYIKEGVESAIKIWFKILAFLVFTHPLFALRYYIFRNFFGATERAGVENYIGFGKLLL